MMKVEINFIHEKFYNKVVDVLELYVYRISGKSAMEILYNQSDDVDHKAHYKVVIFKRKDLNCMPSTADSSMGINCFCSDNFEWYYIDKEYLLEVLNEGKV